LPARAALEELVDRGEAALEELVDRGEAALEAGAYRPGAVTVQVRM
jgi:hypothetical protein